MSIVHSVLQHYQLPSIGEVEYLGGAGGFSGAQIWKIHTPEQSYCLRRWPPVHPDRARLEWINLVLVHVFNNGCPEIAVPLASNSGERFVHQFEFFWELSPWMSGKANFEAEPNDMRLGNAMKCLAKFHLASAQVNLDFRPSPGITARVKQLRDAAKLVGKIRNETPPANPSPTAVQLRERIVSKGEQLAHDLLKQLEPFSQASIPIQPVIRDIWHDHVLFTGDEVSGIVDFGALQMDTVNLDLSRLLGSLLGNDTSRWELAIDSYRSIRKLPIDIECLLALDRCAVLLGSLNWLKWLFIENRQFESQENVDRRIGHLLDRI